MSPKQKRRHLKATLAHLDARLYCRSKRHMNALWKHNEARVRKYELKEEE